MTDRTAHSLALEVTDDLNRAVSLCRAIGVLSDVGVETSEAETALLHDGCCHGHRLAGPDGMGEIGRSGRDDAPDAALLVLIKRKGA